MGLAGDAGGCGLGFHGFGPSGLIEGGLGGVSGGDGFGTVAFGLGGLSAVALVGQHGEEAEDHDASQGGADHTPVPEKRDHVAALCFSQLETKLATTQTAAKVSRAVIAF